LYLSVFEQPARRALFSIPLERSPRFTSRKNMAENVISISLFDSRAQQKS
jgi:hypothetical protein